MSAFRDVAGGLRLTAGACLLLLVGPAGLLSQQPRPRGAGLLVESVEKGMPAAAGLRSGDVLLSWHPAGDLQETDIPAGGPLVSPFDLERVEIEVAPRVPVVLEGERAGRPFELRVSGGEWRVRVRPVLPGPEGELDALAEAAAARGDWTLACWLAVRMAEQAPAEPESVVLDPFALAGDTCASTGEAHQIALAQQALGRAWQARQRYPEAEAAWREALARWEGALAAGLSRAGALHGLGVASWERGVLNEAEVHLRRALDLRQGLAPEGLEVAATLHQLGQVAIFRSEIDSASALSARALEIRQRLAPDSLLVPESLQSLATVLNGSRRIEEAEELLRRALASASRIEPGGPQVAAIELQLGNAAWFRGDVASADGHYRQALAIGERLASVRLVARSVNNLANVARARGDWDAAETLYRRAVAQCRRHWPESLFTAGVVTNLGALVAERGRLAEAAAIYQEALAVGEKAAPRSGTFLFTLVSMAELSQARGDQAGFEAQVEQMIRIVEDPAWTAPSVDAVYGLRGELAQGQGKLGEAEGWYAKSIAAAERYDPGDERPAIAHGRLARLHRRQGRIGEAVEDYRRALEALEAQRFRLGGTGQSRLGFGIRNAHLYQEAVETLLGAGRPEEAFHYWERSRARALSEMLAERDLILDAELPAGLRQRRRSLDAEYDRTQTALSAAEAKEQQEQLQARLQHLRVEQQQAADEARRASPRLASFAYPEPLDLEEVRQGLDPGTALLAYAAGAERIVLFALPAPAAGSDARVEAVVIPLSAEALRSRIAAWRRLAERSAPPPQFFDEARALYDVLIRPVERHLTSAARLVICPDGPLHQLPFAALRRNGAYLAEWKPISLAPSGTVLKQIARSRPNPPKAPDLVAFGDPRAPGLPRLTGGRREVAALRRLFPAAQSYLGDEATEERVKGLGNRARYVHFAGHGLSNERVPLESALALSPARPGSGADDGRLHAWEIFERVRLDADLVTLSACRSAAGAETAGEGLLGLTRAFQYAGARSVLASLWRVPDKSTPPFMTSFYGGLKRGLAKDEALRRAQLASIRAGHHPVRWASFQLYGDWR